MYSIKKYLDNQIILEIHSWYPLPLDDLTTTTHDESKTANLLPKKTNLLIISGLPESAKHTKIC